MVIFGTVSIIHLHKKVGKYYSAYQSIKRVGEGLLSPQLLKLLPCQLCINNSILYVLMP